MLVGIVDISRILFTQGKSEFIITAKAVPVFMNVYYNVYLQYGRISHTNIMHFHYYECSTILSNFVKAFVDFEICRLCTFILTIVLH